MEKVRIRRASTSHSKPSIHLHFWFFLSPISDPLPLHSRPHSHGSLYLLPQQITHDLTFSTTPHLPPSTNHCFSDRPSLLSVLDLRLLFSDRRWWPPSQISVVDLPLLFSADSQIVDGSLTDPPPSPPNLTAIALDLLLHRSSALILCTMEGVIFLFYKKIP
ncbi:hypothetical protein RIF29_28174 [Crotalaria pallida]|uniref:Uncharacterized protein n=1 Tax=Crotalaria pallida TaxID=3830 RepID=A0AAN9I6B9_CROPI